MPSDGNSARVHAPPDSVSFQFCTCDQPLPLRRQHSLIGSRCTAHAMANSWLCQAPLLLQCETVPHKKRHAWRTINISFSKTAQYRALKKRVSATPCLICHRTQVNLPRFQLHMACEKTLSLHSLLPAACKNQTVDFGQRALNRQSPSSSSAKRNCESAGQHLLVGCMLNPTHSRSGPAGNSAQPPCVRCTGAPPAPQAPSAAAMSAGCPLPAGSLSIPIMHENLKP